ncbi:GOLPH3/VPS74 family protein [Agrococcus jejuensis]|uniref:Golgi phosphoprotein 3 (GPP34) n=1 Tax=Agrococcus jejuensis TaxID=399736 RepID=A0A1G8E158_9MICO|nr:GPP34 family phosphoprotein [Agrococcus jejuensis]SDH63409.1 Golgi phosphoprotein 3 (GPP34) [Agrococcus jejuensis]
MDIQATIPETVLLLALDDASGKPVLDGTTLLQTLGGAGLAELVVRGRLRLAEEGEPTGTKPGRFVASTAVVEPALEAFVEHAEDRTPSDALTRVVGWGGTRSVAARLRAELLGELVAEGALAHAETRWLGIAWSERWERGASTEREDAMQSRARALLQGDEPAASDEHLVAALAILHGAKALPKVFPDLDAKPLKTRADALALGSWSSEVVRKAVEAMQVAMMVATTVPITVAASS